MELYNDDEPIQYPQFWDEEWLKIAIVELDKKIMTPEQRFAHEKMIAVNTLIVKNEKKKIEAAKKAVKIEMITEMLLSKKLSTEDIAKFSVTSIDFVLEVQKEILSDK